MVNVSLLRETLDYIKENPQSWRQEVWYTHVNPVTGRTVENMIEVDVEEVNSCGSAFCFAGHAALKSGFPSPPKSSFMQWYKEEYDAEKDRNVTIYVDDHARKVLGLSWGQADVLFAGENTLEDLETLVNALIENPEIGGDELEELVRPDSYDEESCDCGCRDEYDDEDDDTVY